MTKLQAALTLFGMYVGAPAAILGLMALAQRTIYQVRIEPDGLAFRRFGRDAGTLKFVDIHEIRGLQRGVTYAWTRKFGFLMWFGGVRIWRRIARTPDEQMLVAAAPNWRAILAAWEAWSASRSGEAEDLSPWTPERNG